MKTIVLILSSLVLSHMGWAGKAVPIKCLFTYKNAQYSELCSIMNPKLNKKIGGVCIFDRVWKRGTWDPTKPKEKRFVFSRVCDQGIEYSTPEQEALPQGPRLFTPEDWTELKKNHFKSLLEADDSKLKNRLPAICFTKQDPSTQASSAGLPCNNDILTPGFCELKNLNAHSAIKRAFYGNWWVQYTDVNKRSFRLCAAGVTLVDATEADVVYEVNNNEPPMDFEHDGKICIREDAKGKKIETVCQVGTGNVVNACYKRPSPAAATAWRAKVADYVRGKYPTKFPTEYAFRGFKSFRVKSWTPEDAADQTFLDAANAEMNATASWYMNTKYNKSADIVITAPFEGHGVNPGVGYFDQEKCKQIIISKPRELTP